jgi:hypothetical protein
MGLSTVGDISALQRKFEEIKTEIDKRYDESILKLEETSWTIIRKKRDFLLCTTDWTMTPGCTVDQAAWAAYRQALRDVPQKYMSSGYGSVEWPKMPNKNGPNTKWEAS